MSTCTDAGAVVVGGDGVAISVGEVGGVDEVGGVNEVGGDGVAAGVGEVGGVV